MKKGTDGHSDKSARKQKKNGANKGGNGVATAVVKTPAPYVPVDPLIMAGPVGKIPVRTFIENSVRALRKPGQQGIHIVWSGFNEAFQEYYGVPSRAYVDLLGAQGWLVKVLIKGGAYINLPHMPASDAKPPAPAVSRELSKILAAGQQ